MTKHAIEEPRSWTVGVVAETFEGDVVLKMTSVQAASLLERLTWLMGDDE